MSIFPTRHHAIALPLLLLSLLFSLGVRAAPPPSAQPPSQGRVVLTGSTTLANLASDWAQSFSHVYPGITITVADPGSAVGLNALLSGTASAVLISTPLAPTEKNRFEQRHGYPPTLIPVAMDGVAIYVNSRNPLSRISLPQLDAIYSVERRCGARQAVQNWGALGVRGPLATATITPLGLDVNSGAYALFKQRALCGGDFHADFQALAGPAAVEAALASNPAAIGFSSSAMRAASIRAVPVASRDNTPAVLPTVSTIQTGHYPLARQLVIAVNLPVGKPLDPALQAFVDYARSPAGQVVAARAGYVPLPMH